MIFTPHGALLKLTHTKTIQQVLEIALLHIPGSPLCPITMLYQYLASVLLPPQSPLFVCQSQDIPRPILVHQYNTFINASLSAIGINPAHYSSHSSHRGGTTFAFCHDAPTSFIKAQGNWKSNASLVYLHLCNVHKFKILQSITSRLFPTFYRLLLLLLIFLIFFIPPLGLGLEGAIRLRSFE